MRALACRAVWTALGGRPGPVHLNFALREPLVLDGPLPPDEPGGGGRPDGRPWVVRRGGSARVRPRTPRSAMSGALALLVGPAERPVIVAGRDERGDPAAVAAFAAAAGVPLLADPLSGARRGPAASPTTTRCCATRRSPPRTRPTSSSASATCRRRSRCGSGSRRSTARGRSRSTRRAPGRTPPRSSRTRSRSVPAARWRPRRRRPWRPPGPRGSTAGAPPTPPRRPRSRRPSRPRR